MGDFIRGIKIVEFFNNIGMDFHGKVDNPIEGVISI
jgi:hypothetical protein